MILLDTHVLLWVVLEDQRLGRRAEMAARTALATRRLAVSAITFWEIAQLADRARIRLPGTVSDWRRQRLAMGLHEVPLDGEAAVRAAELTGLPGDPADRFIVATAIIHGATLLTADRALLTWAATTHPTMVQDASA